MHQCAHHDHHHHHGPDDYGWAFAIGVGLNVLFVIIEAAYGFWSDSLALLADAGHNLSDVLGLLMAWGGYALAKLAPDSDRTYGWRGSTILAALFNALLLLFAVGGIAWEAVGRLSEPAPVSAPVVITVAAIGVVINTGTALLFVRGRKRDLNLRGAYLHMAADALLSLGVVIAGVIIWATGYLWIDPVTSLLFAEVILIGTWDLLRESLRLALQAVLTGIWRGAAGSTATSASGRRPAIASTSRSQSLSQYQSSFAG
ncbi:MAG: cation diffusion facilitator family transporter, partial [Planctomycetes bacterium]|nr:cation diffusion facilitator family transporter [Planctomycetota bacterium]